MSRKNGIFYRLGLLALTTGGLMGLQTGRLDAAVLLEDHFGGTALDTAWTTLTTSGNLEGASVTWNSAYKSAFDSTGAAAGALVITQGTKATPWTRHTFASTASTTPLRITFDYMIESYTTPSYSARASSFVTIGTSAVNGTYPDVYVVGIRFFLNLNGTVGYQLGNDGTRYVFQQDGTVRADTNGTTWVNNPNDVKIDTGTWYQVTIDIAADRTWSVTLQPQGGSAVVLGTHLDTIEARSGSTTYNFNALNFSGTSNYGPNSITVIDNVVVQTAVPEVASLSLFAAGAAMLLIRKK